MWVIFSGVWETYYYSSTALVEGTNTDNLTKAWSCLTLSDREGSDLRLEEEEVAHNSPLLQNSMPNLHSTLTQLRKLLIQYGDQETALQ